jgi:crossover junction endodeoxyribonuclease RusA
MSEQMTGQQFIDAQMRSARHLLDAHELDSVSPLQHSRAVAGLLDKAEPMRMLTGLITSLCRFEPEAGSVLDERVQHARYHQGDQCPYAVVASVLSGVGDPRDVELVMRVPLLFTGGKPPLSLNDRLSWPAHARKVETIKAITRNAVREANVPTLGHVHVELHYRPKDNRHRDEDNLVATLKPIIDALHQPDERSRWQPIVPGDDPRYVTWSRPTIHAAIKGEPASVWIVLRSAIGLGE